MVCPQEIDSVLLLCRTTGIGGTESVVRDLARKLPERGVRVTTVLDSAEAGPRVSEWMRAAGVPAVTSPALNRFGGLKHLNAAVGEYKRLIADCGPNVIHLHYGVNYIPVKDVIALRRATRLPIVASVHHVWPIDIRLRRLVCRVAARFCDTVVGTSPALADVFRQAGVRIRRLRVVPCGVPVPDAVPARAEARARLGLPFDAFVVGSVSRLEPYKSLPLLISAVARLHAADPSVVLVVAGDGPERGVLGQMAADLPPGTARILGRVPTTDDVYASMDVLALPSSAEGFGLVFIEAAMYGVPSIGARTGGVPYAISEGETGILVEPGNEEELAAAIDRLHRDAPLRRQMGSAALERAHREFTVDRMVDGYRRVYAEAAANR